MRWNCPHCGVSLAVSDDKLGAGWSFSRCYKCGGFALIRRAEVNLVKVDRAPAGEHIILPEATEDPVAMLSEEAAQNLARLRREGVPKNVIRPGARAANPAATSTNSPSSAPANLSPAVAQALAQAHAQATDSKLPPPLPEIAETKPRTMKSRLLSGAISVAAIATVASGIYLYLQGRALWEKARTVATTTTVAQPQNTPRQVAARDAEVVPAPALAADLTDRVRHNAMAPIREPEPAAPAANAAPAALAPVAATNPAPAAAHASILVVQPKAKNADMHSGPGSLYPTVGYADPTQRLLVADWNDRWFKVLLDSTEKDPIPQSAPKTAWIRTDLVQVVPPKAGEKLPEYP